MVQSPLIRPAVLADIEGCLALANRRRSHPPVWLTISRAELRREPGHPVSSQPDLISRTAAYTSSSWAGYGSELTASLPADVSAAARSAPEPLYSTRPRCTRWSTFSATDRCSSSESCPSAECRPSPAIAVAISDTDALPPLSCRRMSSWYGKRLMAMCRDSSRLGCPTLHLANRAHRLLFGQQTGPVARVPRLRA